MSPKITSLTAAGLTAMGLTWAATRGVARPQEPAPPATSAPAPVPSRAPSTTPAPAAEPGANPTVLLLSTGRIVQGEILQDAQGYTLRHRIGVQRFTRRQVLGAFGSLEEVYRYKLARTPRNDPDEEMKLAYWCLEQKLEDHAREHLRAVLALNPENARAKAMLFWADSGTPPSSDPAVAQAGGVMPAGDAGLDPAAPRELRINELRRQPRAVGTPIVFDLPAPIALRRYQEFGRSVHVEVQRHCARCHNADTYGGDFRLVYARNQRDLNDDAIRRANLDAVLRLVNPDDLTHSELLSVAALTHPPDGRPVLGGPNHPSYRVLRTWVTSLYDPARVAEVQPARYAAPSAGASAPVEGFAAGRNGPIAPAAPEPVPGVGQPIAAPPRLVDGQFGTYEKHHRDVPPDARFPDPSALPAAPEAAAQPGQIVAMPDGRQGIVLPDGQVVPYIPRQSGRAEPAPEPSEPGPAPAVEGQAPRRKLDADALQKFLMNRAGPR